MKKLILIILFLSVNVSVGMAEWQQVYGSPYIYSICVSGTEIYTGTGYGLFKSTNNGASWQQTSLNTNYLALAVSPSGSNILAGTYSGGIHVSTNGGTNWIQSSLTDKVTRSFLTSGGNTFAGTEYNGIYTSTNNGMNWIQSPFNNRSVRSFAIHNGNLFAGTDTFGVYISTNNGTSWNQTGLNNTNIYCIAVSGSDMYAGCQNGIYKSTNGGQNWTNSISGITVYSMTSYAGSLFAVANSNGAYVSNDNGVSWQQRNEGLDGNNYLGTLVILDGNLFAGATANLGIGIYKRPISELIGIINISAEVPERFSLSQNYPNPFNPVTIIEFSLPKSAFVKLVVYDISGRELETLASQNMTAGTYKADWDASRYSSGVYFYTIASGSYHQTKKMIVIK